MGPAEPLGTGLVAGLRPWGTDETDGQTEHEWVVRAEEARLLP